MAISPQRFGGSKAPSAVGALRRACILAAVLDTQEPTPYTPLSFIADERQDVLVRELALALLGFYSGESLSATQWRKRGTFQRKEVLKKGGELVSRPLGYSVLTELLTTSRLFDHRALRLTPPESPWLDKTIGMSLSAPIATNDGTTIKIQVLTELGKNFPLTPTLDREGWVYTSLQQATLRRIKELRDQAVASSALFQEDVWFSGLRALVGDSISLIDMTLHQLYYKAKYDPLPGWVFDQSRLNSVAPLKGGRLRAKFGRVFAITGVHASLNREMSAFNRLRHLRNHLQHWDPPCIAFTMEDAARWLNDVVVCATINWRLRQVVRAPPCEPLIALLLSPRARFTAKLPEKPRESQSDSVGYASVIWSDDLHDSGHGVG